MAEPVVDVAAFADVVTEMEAGNPDGCRENQPGAESHAAIKKSREANVGCVIYVDDVAVTIGRISIRWPTVAVSTTNIATVLTNAGFATVMGGTAVHAPLPSSEGGGPHLRPLVYQGHALVV